MLARYDLIDIIFIEKLQYKTTMLKANSKIQLNDIP